MTARWVCLDVAESASAGNDMKYDGGVSQGKKCLLVRQDMADNQLGRASHH